MSNNNPISILIQLDSHLNLIARSFVNPLPTGEDEGSTAEIYRREVDLTDGKVRLYTVFEYIWEELMEFVGERTVDKILFVIGDQAGFTNSRIIYIWLKSHAMVYPTTQLSVIKLNALLNLEVVDEEAVYELMEQGSQELQYSAEPRIGIK